MNINKIKLSLALLCGLLFVPGTVDASDAVWLTDTTALFTIDFGFSLNEFDVEVPIAAKNGVSYLDRVDHVGYTIEADKPGIPAITTLTSIVLGNTDVTGTRYDVPAGTDGAFTLVVLATFSEPLEDAEVRARVTKLPYWLNGKRTTVHQNQLDELDAPSI